MTDKPATTVHGTGSGEAQNELCPRCHDKKILHKSGGCMAMDCSCSLTFVPTPPASPTVTLTFEVPALADTLARHLHDYFIVHRAFGGERLSENELMVMLLALLRAAERQQ